MKKTGTIAAGLVLVAGLISGCPPVTINYPQSTGPGAAQYPGGGSYPNPGVGASGFNLTGQWIGNGYQCPGGGGYTETVQVSHQNQQISAVKISGDPCVPANYKTFEGSLSGYSGQLNCAIGSAQRPASGWVPGNLNVIDANSFDACGVRFVRSGVAPGVAAGSPYPGATGTLPSNPVVQPGVKSVAPGYSPVHILIPNNWISTRHPIYTSQFNVTFSDPNDEVAVGFRFMNNWNSARSESDNLVSWLGQNLLIPGSMRASGGMQKTQINGMQAEFHEFKGQFNAPSQADHGKSVDLAVALVFAPGNRAVGVVAMGLSKDVLRHQATSRQILTSLTPR